MKDLKQKTIQGGLVKLLAQGASLFVRVGSLMILARLLVPKDFGLVGMVTAFTGVLDSFRDFGLSSAAVQRSTVTEEQVSTLFWINMLVGAVLSVLGFAMAPAIALFYHEPRLAAVMDVLAMGFLFNAAGVQHSVLLQRQMRFTALTVVGTTAFILGTAVAIGAAMAGYGYWSLVAMTIVQPLANTIGLWLATSWIPGKPARQTGIRSMMRFGGTLTLNGLVAYIAFNAEKVLLGRFWGAEAIGLYGRAYQLVNVPTSALNGAVGEVAFAGLSRVQDDPVRFRSYFLKGYSLVLAMTLPLTIACTFFANDVILVLLGPKWGDAAPIFRLLAPTVLMFAIINPVGWVLYSLGLVGRGLKVALVFAPIILVGYLIGLPHGPKGVAFAYSAVMIVWAVPHIAWCLHRTVISLKDILITLGRPLASSIVAGGLALGIRLAYGQFLSPLPRLVLEISVLLLTYMGILLFVAGQKTFYLDLIKQMRGSSSIPEETLVST